MLVCSNSLTDLEKKAIPLFRAIILPLLDYQLDHVYHVSNPFKELCSVLHKWLYLAHANLPATHKKFETQGVDIFHFEGDKIKEVWTICDMSVLAL